jgi:DNA-binding transcriptional regulator YbjK
VSCVTDDEEAVLGAITMPTYSPRQRTLLAAAVQVLARSGLRGLTHRAVDSQAGLPQGSCSAYTRTRLALLTRLTEYVAGHFARDIEQLTGRIQEHPGVDGYAVRQTLAMLRSWLREPELLLARMELAIEGTREPEIQRISDGHLRELELIVEQVMESAGHQHSRTRAATLIAAFDGVLLHALRVEPSRRPAYLRESVELLMGALVGEQPHPTA